MSIDNNLISYSLMSLPYNLSSSDDKSENSNSIVELDEELPIAPVITIHDVPIIPIITIPPVLIQRTSDAVDRKRNLPIFKRKGMRRSERRNKERR